MRKQKHTEWNQKAKAKQWRAFWFVTCDFSRSSLTHTHRENLHKKYENKNHATGYWNVTHMPQVRESGGWLGGERTSFGIKTVSGADCLRWLRTPSHMIYLQLHLFGKTCGRVCLRRKVKWCKKLRKFPVNSWSFLRLISIPQLEHVPLRSGRVPRVPGTPNVLDALVSWPIVSQTAKGGTDWNFEPAASGWTDVQRKFK